MARLNWTLARPAPQPFPGKDLRETVRWHKPRLTGPRAFGEWQTKRQAEGWKGSRTLGGKTL